MKILYTNDAVQEIADRYLNKYDGELIVLDEGCLAFFGLAILTAHKKKVVIIKEVYLNEWSSANSIRLYNKMPKKYEKMIEDYYNQDSEDDE